MTGQSAGKADATAGGADAGLRVVEEHLQRIAALKPRAYLHGSLALGGYHHGISDQDLVVLLDHPLTPDERRLLDDSHCQAGPPLAAAYVLDASDPEQEHPTWTHGWSGNRRVSLTSLVRALVTQQTGELCGKDAAVARLEEHGVPERLAAAVRARREGREALPHNRLRRAVATHRTARRLMRAL